MSISDYLDVSRVRLDVEVRSKKHALQVASEIIAESSEALSPQRIFDAMFQRERLGCTGLGHGVALPHARLSSATECVGALIRTSGPIDFEADDQTEVELIFAMIFPEASGDENMYNLSHVATLFMDPSLRQKLIDAATTEEAYQVVIDAAMPPTGELEASG